MKRFSILAAAVLAAILSPSCVPYVEEPPAPQPDVARNSRTAEETAADRERSLRERQADREREQREDDRRDARSGADEDTVAPIDDRADDPEPPAPEPKPRTRVARAVPGKPGFVFSPFNNKVIDVKGIPSGTLVADPTYPSSEKKYFRVP